MIALGTWLLIILNVYGATDTVSVTRFDTQKQCESVGQYIVDYSARMNSYKCIQIDENGVVNKKEGQ